MAVTVTKKIIKKIIKGGEEYKPNLFGRAGYPMPKVGDKIVEGRYLNPECPPSYNSIIYGWIFEEDLELFEAEIEMNIGCGGIADAAYEAASIGDEKEMKKYLEIMENKFKKYDEELFEKTKEKIIDKFLSVRDR